MKKRISVILLIAFLLLPTLPIRAYASGKYVASRNSDVYHYASCSYVSSIYERNKIWFNSAEAAEATGRRGCSRCRPSAKSETSNQTPATPAAKSYSQSDINEAYANGHADGYLLGKDVGYDSGYEAARNELEAEYQEKLDDAVSDASSSAYALSAYLGIPAACVVCMALLNKQERELIKKYGVSSSRKHRSSPTKASGSAPKKTFVPPPTVPKLASNSAVIGPNPASGIQEMRFSDDAFIVTFGDGKKYLYFNVPKYLGAMFAQADNCLLFFKEQIDGVYPYMLVPD